jgi:hypothetical protein
MIPKDFVRDEKRFDFPNFLIKSSSNDGPQKRAPKLPEHSRMMDERWKLSDLLLRMAERFVHHS